MITGKFEQEAAPLVTAGTCGANELSLAKRDAQMAALDSHPAYSNTSKAA